MRSTRLTVAALAASVALGLTACSTATVSEPAGASASTSASPSATMPAEFNFSAPTLAGGTFDGTSLYGESTILWFWAPWCGSCVADAKYVLAAIPQLPDGVQIIGVPTFADEDSMHQFADTLDVNGLTNIMDVDGSLAIAFGASALPSSTVIYPDGFMASIPGSLSTDEILQIAQKIAP